MPAALFLCISQTQARFSEDKSNFWGPEVKNKCIYSCGPLEPGQLNCSVDRKLFSEQKEIGNNALYTTLLIIAFTPQEVI